MDCQLNVIPAYVMHSPVCLEARNIYTNANVQLHLQVACIQVVCNCTVNIDCLGFDLSTGSGSCTV